MRIYGGTSCNCRQKTVKTDDGPCSTQCGTQPPLVVTGINPSVRPRLRGCHAILPYVRPPSAVTHVIHGLISWPVPTDGPKTNQSAPPNITSLERRLSFFIFLLTLAEAAAACESLWCLLLVIWRYVVWIFHHRGPGREWWICILLPSAKISVLFFLFFFKATCVWS